MGSTEGVETVLAWRSSQFSLEEERHSTNPGGVSSLHHTVLMTRAAGVQRKGQSVWAGVVKSGLRRSHVLKDTGESRWRKRNEVYLEPEGK